MEHITTPNRCTGCAACVQLCPVHCITMQPDAEGFLRPVIDQATCVDCGKCARGCPVNTASTEFPKPTAWAAIHSDESVRQNSSSGGVFAPLAQAILADGGAVCAPVLDEQLTVRHIVTKDPAVIRKMQGSKYVQSDLGDCYTQVQQLLEENTPVLFSGTPCQIGGLYAVLKKEYPHLYTQDIICHGVPSPLVWNRYLAEQGSPVKAASFRDKSQGWLNFSMSLTTEAGTTRRPLIQDPYLQVFLRDFDLRPSCYDCAFKTVGRQADLTLADFWGIKKVLPDFFDDKGTSLLLVHTPKGEALRQRITPLLRMTETDLTAALAANPAVDHSVTRPAVRNAFFPALQNSTITQLAAQYCRDSTITKAKNLLRRVVNKLR